MTSIRPATLTDAEGIARVHTRSWQAAYRNIVPEAFLDGLRWELRHASWSKEPATPTLPKSSVLVAVDEEVLGFASVGPSRDEELPDAFELYALYAAPEAWDTGVGTGLLEGALAAVPAEVAVTLWVLEENARGRRFYERHGFSPDGSSKVVELGGRPLVELRYVRRGTMPE